MEALSMVSSVTTVVQIANDITGAVKAVSQNKESCEKLAERVEGIGELLKELGDGSSRSSSPSTATTAATRSLVTRLERSLRRALVLVRSCQVISSRVYGLVAGSWQTDQFDEVNAEIDRCVLDLSLALIAGIDRNRKLNDPHAVTPPSRAHARRRCHRSALTVDMTTAQDDDEEQIAAAASARDDGVGEDEKNGALICYGEQDYHFTVTYNEN
uniref:DUF7792 domain-containing protein n=1 Tax=Oryza brachyantha TaxID=4533 RepID=J3NA43_ORYBR